MNTLLKRAVKELSLVIGAAALLGGCVAYPVSYAPTNGHYYSRDTPIHEFPGHFFYYEPFQGGRYYGGRGYEHEEDERGGGYRRFGHDDDHRGGDHEDED